MTSNTQSEPEEKIASAEAIERAAKAICEVWGYLWEGDPEDDDQIADEEAQYPGDTRPTRGLYRAAAKAVLDSIPSQISEAVKAERESNSGVYADIRAERARQDAKWGGPEHDDTHNASDWRFYRDGYEGRAEIRDVQRAPLRDLIVKVAALAVAQIESMDRAAIRARGEAK